jgi:hypothetical protein
MKDILDRFHFVAHKQRTVHNVLTSHSFAIAAKTDDVFSDIFSSPVT